MIEDKEKGSYLQAPADPLIHEQQKKNNYFITNSGFRDDCDPVEIGEAGNIHVSQSNVEMGQKQNLVSRSVFRYKVNRQLTTDKVN